MQRVPSLSRLANAGSRGNSAHGGNALAYLAAEAPPAARAGNARACPLRAAVCVFAHHDVNADKAWSARQMPARARPRLVRWLSRR